MNVFVFYGHDSALTDAFSSISDVRVIWGGDSTIESIRESKLPARSIDIAFADRYSICVLGANHVLNLTEDALTLLTQGFFNDAYLMDQNACSSPRVVVWIGSKCAAKGAQTRFWLSLSSIAERRYDIAAISAVDKLTQACKDAIELDAVDGFQRSDSRVFRVELQSLFVEIEHRHCHSGYFYEYVTEEIDVIAPYITKKCQTLTYAGVTKSELASFVLRNRLVGIDRMVPVGTALDIGVVWDGYELIRTMSRVCTLE